MPVLGSILRPFWRASAPGSPAPKSRTAWQPVLDPVSSPVPPAQADVKAAANGADGGASWQSMLDDRWLDEVLVVFGDAPDKRTLRFLKPGFRHCFVLIAGTRAGDWICLDPLSHRLTCHIWRLSPMFDPAAHYRHLGQTCLWVKAPRHIARRSRIGLFTCVELVKRMLGIRGFWVVTPWRLYRHLDAAKTGT